jgi:Uma2 family endonuclease
VAPFGLSHFTHFRAARASLRIADERGRRDAMLQPRMFDPDLLAPEGIRRLSRNEYDKLVDLGVFEDERVELLRGMLVTMSPQGAPHATISSWFVERLVRLLDESYDIRGHCPYAATEDSEPEPDISVSRRIPGVLAHPQAALLLIEVSESSIRKDRQLKAPIYGEARVPEYWIVDISGAELAVHVHTRPTNEGYRQIEVVRDGEVLRPTTLAGIEIAVAEIPWTR